MLPSRRKRAHHDSLGMSASQPTPSTVSPHGRYRPRGGLPGSSTPTPPFKKPTLQRTVSSPFQVLNASIRTTRNPFERLASSPATASLPVNFTSMHGSGLEEDNDDDGDQVHSEERDGDNKDDSSLRLFSFSQPPSFRPSRPEELDSDYDTEVDDDHDGGSEKDMLATSNHPTTRSKLHDALEQSLRASSITPIQELDLPSGPSDGRVKKDHMKIKTTLHLPLDWTLKSSLSLTSKDSFEWCDYGPVADEIDALHLFNKASLPASSPTLSTLPAITEPTDETASSRVLVMSALYHWIYPVNAPDAVQARTIGRLLKNASNMSQKERGSIVEIFTRNSEWRQSFCNLYQLFRNKACPYFYYIGTSFAVLFQNESSSLSGEIEATLTHSTRGLQETLTREHIFFEALPDIVGTVAQDHIGAKHDLDDDGDEDEVGMIEDNDKDDSGHASISGKKSGSSERKSPTPLSNALHFKGRMRVHALFDFLLNYRPEVEEERLYHSPALIASVPFLHGSLKRAQLSKSRQVSKQVPGTDRIERENRIDVQGIILPAQLKRLLELMATQQTNTGFTFQATSQPITHGVNLRPLAEKGTDSQGGAADGEQQPLISQRGQDQYGYDPSSKLFSWTPTS